MVTKVNIKTRLSDELVTLSGHLNVAFLIAFPCVIASPYVVSGYLNVAFLIEFISLCFGLDLSSLNLVFL